MCPIGVGRLGEGEIDLRYLGGAKSIHASWLRCYAQIEATQWALWEMLSSPERVDEATAMRMVSVLFAVLAKKKSEDENAMLLGATVDMLSPRDASVSMLMGVWEPINAHPFVLAVAIKKLIATAKFTSASELRDAMKEVCRTIGNSAWAMEYIGNMIWRADAIVFAGDRAAWNANYAKVDSRVARAMLDDLIGEGPDDYDDEELGPTSPPSPRWLALNALVEAKRAAEKAAALLVAGAAKPMKQTQKAAPTESSE